jgi:hypothetical protein
MNTTRLLLCFTLCTALVACNSGKQFASSFGKRRYTKGYYVFSSGTGKSINPLTENKIAAKPKNDDVLQATLTETNKAKTTPLNNLAFNTAVRNIAKQSFFAERSLLFIKPFDKLILTKTALNVVPDGSNEEGAKKTTNGPSFIFIGALGVLVGLGLLIWFGDVLSAFAIIMLVAILLGGIALICVGIDMLQGPKDDKEMNELHYSDHHGTHESGPDGDNAFGGMLLLIIGLIGTLIGGFFGFVGIFEIGSSTLLIIGIPILLLALTSFILGIILLNKPRSKDTYWHDTYN